jgi:ubiquinone/menaquinone biosynthesis C-methylase UbiE
MQRKPEPELMNDPVQAAAYAAADFSEPHGLFIEKFREVFPGINITGHVLDLGCGPADISIRFAQVYPECHIEGVEGAPAMLLEGAAAVKRAGLHHRIKLIQGVIPDLDLHWKKYQVILSNSLLHHLHNPGVLWQYLKKVAAEDTLVFVMDLIRPESRQKAEMLVNTYCESAPDILRRDFYNSLCAAFTPKEIEQQIEETGLVGLNIDTISDRHLIIFGKFMIAQK